MMTFILTFLVVSIAILGMSVGILAGRRPIQGGCGGKNREIGAGIGCGACGVEGRDGNPAALRIGRHAADWP